MKLINKFIETCEKYKNNIAFEDENSLITYSVMHRDVLLKIEELKNKGILAGDRIAVSLVPPYFVFVLEFACSKLNVTIVFLESFISPSSQEWQDAISSSLAHWSVTFDSKKNEIWNRTNISQLDPKIHAESSERYILLHARTSGTTGQSKGVCLSEESILHAVQNTIKISKCLPTSKAMLLYEPLGLISQLCSFSTLLTGATLVNGLKISQQPTQLLEFIEQYKISHIVLVPQHIEFALKDPNISKRNLSSLEVVMYGAAPVTKKLIQSAREKISCHWLQCYGLTETTGPVFWLLSEEQSLAGFSVGKLAQNCTVQICDPKSGNVLSAGFSGDIMIGGALLMEGYWDESLGKPMSKDCIIDGWFKTGDVGYLDDNQHLILGARPGEEIISQLGYKIDPVEIESVLCNLPDIEEVVALAYKYNNSSEVPIVVCVSKTDHHTMVELIRDTLEKNLDKSKHPEYIVLSEKPLPKGSNGKIQKGRIKEITKKSDLIAV